MNKNLKKEIKNNGFNSGVFYTMQYLVLDIDEPNIAKELGKNAGITKKWALEESKKTGYRVRKMNKFIREEF